MNLWMVRAGKHGTYEHLAFDESISFVGFSQVPDLSHAGDRESIVDLLRQVLPDAPPKRIGNFASQLNTFVHRIQLGDLVVLPLKQRDQIAIGRVTGAYNYRIDLGPEVHHTRSVEWIRDDIPRSELKQDLLYSLGAFMTVCEISRNNALARFQSIVEGRGDPGYRISAAPTTEEGPDDESVTDIGQLARDQIRAHIESNFAGHDLARLVAELLQAEGFFVETSAPGPDGGVDILAGSGTFGLDSPRLLVQVKSGTSPVDAVVLRSLQGVLENFGADRGLLVSWAGFKSSVQREARSNFFKIRLWDSADILSALARNYEKLSDEIRSELPLKRIWTLVLED